MFRTGWELALPVGPLLFIAYLGAERAKERQGTRIDIVEKIPQSAQGKVRDKAAEAVGV